MTFLMATLVWTPPLIPKGLISYLTSDHLILTGRMAKENPSGF